jgi:hypothetical protein
VKGDPGASHPWLGLPPFRYFRRPLKLGGAKKGAITMRLTLVRIRDGKRRILWPLFTLFVLATYGGVIGAAEVFWKLFSGGVSPLVGLFAMFLATLIVVRAVGQSFSLPVHVHETWLK